MIGFATPFTSGNQNKPLTIKTKEKNHLMTLELLYCWSKKCGGPLEIRYFMLLIVIIHENGYVGILLVR